jgi:hypothetical protein
MKTFLTIFESILPCTARPILKKEQARLGQDQKKVHNKAEVKAA